MEPKEVKAIIRGKFRLNMPSGERNWFRKFLTAYLMIDGTVEFDYDNERYSVTSASIFNSITDGGHQLPEQLTSVIPEEDFMNLQWINQKLNEQIAILQENYESACRSLQQKILIIEKSYVEHKNYRKLAVEQLASACEKNVDLELQLTFAKNEVSLLKNDLNKLHDILVQTDVMLHPHKRLYEKFVKIIKLKYEKTSDLPVVTVIAVKRSTTTGAIPPDVGPDATISDG